jgi:hypothetical protein
MCIVGLCVGVYAGLWVCFIGGIMDIICQVRAVETSGFIVLWALVKMAFAVPVGLICALALIAPGAAILAEGK